MNKQNIINPAREDADGALGTNATLGEIIIRPFEEIVLIGSDIPETPNSGLEYFRALKKINFSVVSLEYSDSIQSTLDLAREHRQKFSFSRLPGFAWAVNYAHNSRNVPVFATGRIESSEDITRTYQRLQEIVKQYGPTAHLCSTKTLKILEKLI